MTMRRIAPQQTQSLLISSQMFHMESPTKRSKTKHITNITELLKILEVSDDDKTILMTLVPRDAGESVKVGGVKIEYEKLTGEKECP
ncbi:hypothetical protein L6164_036622 [Bauhinia variegata]|uniref:Uncharacterized protein n=1 Tax=Bauhinia variegata TaxID=167791 RepID=A0ACB9KHR1_BAUVA|nr:hypothetical protein L6164_036622 [Bauhinia variegata]